MKKILLATTLIAASTGYAAAEVAVTGTARMGIVYDGTDAAFSSRVRIKFVATGETDSGLSFGASMRADQTGGNGDGSHDHNTGTTNGDSTVYISGAFGKVTMGDTGNASDNILGQVSGVGYTGLGDMNELAFVTHAATGVLYEYSAGAVTFGLGAEQTNTNNAMSAAVKYSTDAYMVGLAYESDDFDSQTTLMGSVNVSGATIKAKIVDGITADTRYALSVDYTMSGATVTAYYADHSDEFTVTGNGYDGKAYGIGASYALGGGASVLGGIARNEGFDTIAELGVNLSF